MRFDLETSVQISITNEQKRIENIQVLGHNL